MESLYPSLLCSVILIIGCIEQTLSQLRSPESKTMFISAMFYFAGLFAYFFLPALTLPPILLTQAAALFYIIMGIRSNSSWQLSVLVGLGLTVITTKFIRMFPFHRWHGVPVAVLVILLWTVTVVILTKSIHEASTCAAFTCISLFTLSWVSGRGDVPYTFLNEDSTSLYDLQCTAYWGVLCTIRCWFSLLRVVGRVWERRYKPII